jgi:hypothetical protein
VESQLGFQASIAGAVTLAIGIEFRIFLEGIAVSMLRRMGMSRWKSLCMGNLLGRAYCSCFRALQLRFHFTYALALRQAP